MRTSKPVVCNFWFLVIVNSAIIGAKMAFLDDRMSDQWSPQTVHLYRYTLFVLDKNCTQNEPKRLKDVL